MIGKLREYEAMAECEQQLWWYKTLHELTLQKIKSHTSSSSIKILDAGCGTGGMLAFLKENGFQNIQGFDLSSDAVNFAKERLLQVNVMDITAAGQAYNSETFDVILCHDVLYFFSRGEQNFILAELTSLLAPGGLLLINLPAGRFFRGTHDLAVGITKRYSKKYFSDLNSLPVTIIEKSYWPFLLSFLIAAVRSWQRIKMTFVKKIDVVSDVRMPSRRVNELFYRISSWENRKIKYKPFGSSLFLVLKKK